jgi:hypothetical protein
MLEHTLSLIQNPEMLGRLSRGAFERGKDFSKAVFDQKVHDHFSAILKDYKFQ